MSANFCDLHNFLELVSFGRKTIWEEILKKMNEKNTTEDYEKLFRTLEKYFRDKISKNEQPDPEVFQISEELTKIIRERRQKASRDSWFTWICVTLLFIGIIVLFWQDLEIHLLFCLRYIIVLVIKMQRRVFIEL